MKNIKDDRPVQEQWRVEKPDPRTEKAIEMATRNTGLSKEEVLQLMMMG